MKTRIFPTLILFLISLFLFSPSNSFADVWVNGYFRSNGTYVDGYWRSNPDGDPYNNWSFPGNTNPYTGVTAGGNPDTYLQNYYSRSSWYDYTPSYNYGSYDSGDSGYTSNFNYSYPAYDYTPSYYNSYTPSYYDSSYDSSSLYDGYNSDYSTGGDY